MGGHVDSQEGLFVALSAEAQTTTRAAQLGERTTQ